MAIDPQTKAVHDSLKAEPWLYSMTEYRREVIRLLKKIAGEV